MARHNHSRDTPSCRLSWPVGGGVEPPSHNHSHGHSHNRRSQEVTERWRRPRQPTSRRSTGRRPRSPRRYLPGPRRARPVLRPPPPPRVAPVGHDGPGRGASRLHPQRWRRRTPSRLPAQERPASALRPWESRLPRPRWSGWPPWVSASGVRSSATTAVGRSARLLASVARELRRRRSVPVAGPPRGEDRAVRRPDAATGPGRPTTGVVAGPARPPPPGPDRPPRGPGLEAPTADQVGTAGTTDRDRAARVEVCSTVSATTDRDRPGTDLDREDRPPPGPGGSTASRTDRDRAGPGPRTYSASRVGRVGSGRRSDPDPLASVEAV